MDRLSVIVTACNNVAVVQDALDSVEHARMFLRTAGHSTEVEVVVVDDGSTDATSEVIREFSQGKDGYHVLRTGAPTSPACARNRGAANATGELLYFLDADDRFLPPQLALALKVLQDPTVMFLKTGVRTSDPVHPEWKQRIANSVVINLCVRRRCHDFIGGFLDYQLVHRQGDGFGPALDVFYKTEDMYYNLMLHSLFRGAHSDQDTVEYRRYPGNSFDRRYEEFCRPPSAGTSPPDALTDLRHRLAVSIFNYRLSELKARLAEAQKAGRE